jgi:hypothetical protein
MKSRSYVIHGRNLKDQDWCFNTCPAEIDPLMDPSNAEEVGAVLKCIMGESRGPVAVRIRFDHSHDPRARPDVLADDRKVVAKRRETDPCLCRREWSYGGLLHAAIS